MKEASTGGPWANGIVLFANSFEFSAADIFHYPQVQSRCLIYCRSGHGTIVLNNESFPVTPGDFFLTTWNHSISYQPDPECPYILWCIHVIPSFPERQKIYFVPFHFPMPQFDEYHCRKNEPLPGFEELFHTVLADNAPLVQLMRYVISCYERQCPEQLLRQFVSMLVYELQLLRHAVGVSASSQLQLIVGEIDRHLEDHDILDWVRNRTGLSTATIHRLMRREFHTTPGKFIRSRKLHFAAELLRETNIPIADISERLHFCDSFYFSRLFKQEFGCSPSCFRRMPEISLTAQQPVRHSHFEEVIRQNFSRRYLPRKTGISPEHKS